MVVATLEGNLLGETTYHYYSATKTHEDVLEALVTNPGLQRKFFEKFSQRAHEEK